MEYGHVSSDLLIEKILHFEDLWVRQSFLKYKTELSRTEIHEIYRCKTFEKKLYKKTISFS